MRRRSSSLDVMSSDEHTQAIGRAGPSGNKAHLIILLEKIAVSLQASCFKENRDMCSIANQIVWQNHILVAFLETSGHLLLH